MCLDVIIRRNISFVGCILIIATTELNKISRSLIIALQWRSRCISSSISFDSPCFYLTGIGFGVVNTLCLSLPASHFDRHRDLALGIAAAGNGVGALVMPVVYEALINIAGWRVLMLYSGAIVLQLLPFTMLLRPPSVPGQTLSNEDKPDMAHIKDHHEPPGPKFNNDEKKANTDCETHVHSDKCETNLHLQRDACDENTLKCETTDSDSQSNDSIANTSSFETTTIQINDWSFLRRGNLWILLLGNNLWNTGSLMAVVFMTALAVERGLTQSQSAWSLSVVGGCYLVWCVIMAVAVHWITLSRLHLMNLGSIIRGSGLIIMPYCTRFVSVLKYVI